MAPAVVEGRAQQEPVELTWRCGRPATDGRHRCLAGCCPTPPAQHHLPNTTCPTPPAQHHLPNTTCPTPPAQHHPPDTTRPSAARVREGTECSASHRLPRPGRTPAWGRRRADHQFRQSAGSVAHGAGVPRARGRPDRRVHGGGEVRAGRDERGGAGWPVLGRVGRARRAVVRRCLDGAAGRRLLGHAVVRAHRRASGSQVRHHPRPGGPRPAVVGTTRTTVGIGPGRPGGPTADGLSGRSVRPRRPGRPAGQARSARGVLPGRGVHVHRGGRGGPADRRQRPRLPGADRRPDRRRARLSRVSTATG